MNFLLKIVAFCCLVQFVSPEVNIPAIFQKPQKPKEKIKIPTPLSLEIRDATPEEYSCVGKPDGNYANMKNCTSFYACLKNTTYYIGCPVFESYQSYFNPVKRLCDKSDELACLDFQEIPEIEVVIREDEESNDKEVENEVNKSGEGTEENSSEEEIEKTHKEIASEENDGLGSSEEDESSELKSKHASDEL